MTDFWEQQMMDRLMELCFHYRKQDSEIMPKEQVKDVIDYTKFLLKKKEEDIKRQLAKR